MSEPVKPRRIVDQDLFADRRIRRPYWKLIEQTAVVDLKQRRDLGRLAAGRRHRARMRPIRAPKDTAGIRGDGRAGKRRAVGVVGEPGWRPTEYGGRRRVR